MKTKSLCQLGVIFTITLFFFTSCNKIAPDVVSPSTDEFQLQEPDETAMWLGNSGIATGQKKAFVSMKVFATGFNNPRGLKFSPNGRLYVAEGGTGAGTNSTVGICDQVPFPVGPYLGGTTGGRISKVNWKGERSTVTDQLPSSHANEIIGGDVEGVADVTFIHNTLYALLAGAGCSHGVADVPNGVIKVKPNGSWKMVANVSDWLKAHPVQNPEPDDFEPDGTPYSIITVGDDFYALEPNHGDLMKITTSGHISRVVDISATQGHIVPTALTFHDGNFFVGNLHPFPIVDGSSNIYKITPSGQVSISVPGFTTVLGVAFDKKGRLYVLENTTGNNLPPLPTPGTGKIIRIDKSGNRETIVSGLNLPTGMTFGPDGKLYVSNWGFGPTAIGGGEILQICIGDNDH
jgi:hypothetical protein